MPRNHVKSKMPRNQVQSNTLKKSNDPVVPALSSRPVKSQQPSSFGQTIKEGFGFGLGSSIAHTLMGSLFGSNRSHHTVAISSPSKVESDTTVSRSNYSDSSAIEQKEYVQCIKEGGTEEICKQYLS
jgi:hypothetical protein